MWKTKTRFNITNPSHHEYLIDSFLTAVNAIYCHITATLVGLLNVFQETKKRRNCFNSLTSTPYAHTEHTEHTQQHTYASLWGKCRLLLICLEKNMHTQHFFSLLHKWILAIHVFQEWKIHPKTLTAKSNVHRPTVKTHKVIPGICFF